MPPAPVINIVLLLINFSKSFLSNLVSALPNKSSISIGRVSFELLSCALFSSDILGRRANDIPILSVYFSNESISSRDIFWSAIIIFVILFVLIR